MRLSFQQLEININLLADILLVILILYSQNEVTKTLFFLNMYTLTLQTFSSAGTSSLEASEYTENM